MHTEPGNGKQLAEQRRSLIPPTQPGEWSLDQIISALSRPLPASILESKQRGGQTILYLPWYAANRILDRYAPGWFWEVRSLQFSPDRLFLVGRLTLPTSRGLVYREATGSELLKEAKEIWVGEKPNRRLLKDEYDRPLTELKELAYGDPSSNAESMAFRRAAARFGLGLYLYDKD